MINIIILSSSEDEPEEQFTVSLVLASGNVAIDPLSSSATITVAQRGMPFGEIGFFGDVLETLVVSEEEGVEQPFSLPLVRSGPAIGKVAVTYEIQGAEADVSPSLGTVTFFPTESQASLELAVVPDTIPELEETYTVVLTGASGGAAINTEANTAMFRIRFV